MHLHRLLSILCLSIAGTNCLNAEALPPFSGASLLPEDISPHQWSFYPGKHNNASVARAEPVVAEHPSFQQAMRVHVIQPSGHFYNGCISLPANQAVASGDTLLIRLYFRSIQNAEETGEGFATVFVQGPKPKYKKYLIREITASKEWKEYTLPAKVTDTLPKGQLSLLIGAGGGSKAQIWEVGGIEFLNYGDGVDPSDFPKTKTTYAGREIDALWRVAANKRIERYRKGDFHVRVTTLDGKPVAGATVEVRQQRHAYHFGSVVTPALITGKTKDAEIYRQKVLELFNQSGMENALKWGPWESEWGGHFKQPVTLKALKWLKDYDFYTRGHVLVWPSKKHMGKRIQPYLPANDPQSADPIAKQIVLDHIENITTATADYLDEWDVLNEPYHDHYLMDAFGDQVMVGWFKEARQHLPTHALYINDAGILSDNGRDIIHHEDYIQKLDYLLENGAPVTGLGLQGHFGTSPTSIEKVYRILDQFHNAFPKLNIRITEFDIQTDDESLLGDYTRDFLTIVFSHPATVGVQCWGFWAGAHWRPESALYTKDWREKLNGREWKRLTREVWWTTLSGQTQNDGTFSGRGFYGDYTVRVSHQGQTQEVEFQLSKSETNEPTVRF
ncbi:endo-1,4-beta-xylanase [Puniceicoccus vermicola]|uniref:Beta-xylanase n=1 Tax=Puniceicoccus vermicola TaxID=388746 RepID=A0A7X1E4R2_9BACT|nr:endo-1,4-beta-xylanase [Puniceicoccus vermicola]MBC2602795.1 endo-1,4-beta-xylanase [Puniceicoccus vermicola]